MGTAELELQWEAKEATFVTRGVGGILCASVEEVEEGHTGTRRTLIQCGKSVPAPRSFLSELMQD